MEVISCFGLLTFGASFDILFYELSQSGAVILSFH